MPDTLRTKSSQTEVARFKANGNWEDSCNENYSACTGRVSSGNNLPSEKGWFFHVLRWLQYTEQYDHKGWLSDNKDGRMYQHLLLASLCLLIDGKGWWRLRQEGTCVVQRPFQVSEYVIWSVECAWDVATRHDCYIVTSNVTIGNGLLGQYRHLLFEHWTTNITRWNSITYTEE